MKLLLATGNKGKAAEFRELLKDFHLPIQTLSDFPMLVMPEENGSTFEENALIKARGVAASTGLVTIADDSGLAVDVLDGAPGVYSARYSGIGATDDANNAKLLEALEGVPAEKRSAAFVCVIAVAAPTGEAITASGRCDGRIGFEGRGKGGFGYDPLFIVEGDGCTMAELAPERKNELSHRGAAMRAIWNKLPKFISFYHIRKS